MKYLYHKQPLVISAQKQNKFHSRFNEKVFYQNKNPHTIATYRLLSLSKKIKFMFLLFFVISIVLGIGYVNSHSKTMDSASSNSATLELLDNDNNSTAEDDKNSDFETINDVKISPEKSEETSKDN